MATLNPDASTGLQNLNLLQPTSFKLSIEREALINLQFFAQSVSHPGMSLSAAEMPYSRVSPGVPMPGDKLTFGELSCIVLLDEEMNGYNELYQWMLRLVNSNYVAPTQRIQGQVPSHADVTVSVLSSHNNVTRRIRYIDAVPTLLGDINFDAAAAGTQYLSFPISFRFSYFEIT